MKVTENYDQIKQQIQEACLKSNRDPNEVTVIAVTKYVTIERASEALEAGITHLGENRADGLLAKWQVLADKPTWHYIGTLQSRKVKDVIDKVDYIHSLDRLSLAKEIELRTEKVINCLVQVNVSGEESKHGLNIDEVIPFIQSLKDFPNILVVGLMTMAPFTNEEEVLRNCFRELKQLQQSVQQLQLPYAPCRELSMGMSNDYQIAIEEGATMIRIGTALVGE